MLIENFRFNRLGEYLFQVTDYGNHKNATFQTNYIDYAQYSVKSIIDDFYEFENPITYAKPDYYNSINTFIYSFFAIESFINLLGRVFDLQGILSFKDFKKKELDSRLNQLLNILSIDKATLSKQGVYKVLNEYKSIRNELFHDRQFDSRIKLNHSILTNIPPYFSICDSIEAFKILLIIFSVFRYTFCNIDLLPFSIVRNENGNNFFQIDKIYDEMLCPWYNEILKKHNLSSDFKSDVISSSPDIKFNAEKFEVHILIYGKSDHSFTLEDSKTTIGRKYANTLGGVRLDESKFRIPSYGRKVKKDNEM